jgi:hypothetical protein
MKYGILVKLKEDFSVVRETLERIGIRSDKEKILWPSCYVVQTDKDGLYRIVHFKHLYMSIGKESNIDDTDVLRTKTITQLLYNWDLVDPLEEIDEIMIEKIDILKASEKKEYSIKHKFRFKKKITLEA